LKSILLENYHRFQNIPQSALSFANPPNFLGDAAPWDKVTTGDILPLC
jgi:hypothetical protein